MSQLANQSETEVHREGAVSRWSGSVVNQCDTEGEAELHREAGYPGVVTGR
jgi:hypothetical protein